MLNLIKKSIIASTLLVTGITGATSINPAHQNQAEAATAVLTKQSGYLKVVKFNDDSLQVTIKKVPGYTSRSIYVKHGIPDSNSPIILPTTIRKTTSGMVYTYSKRQLNLSKGRVFTITNKQVNNRTGNLAPYNATTMMMFF